MHIADYGSLMNTAFATKFGEAIRLTKRERDLCQRAADLLNQIDDLSERHAGVAYTDGHDGRTDLVFGVACLEELAATGEWRIT